MNASPGPSNAATGTPGALAAPRGGSDSATPAAASAGIPAAVHRARTASRSAGVSGFGSTRVGSRVTATRSAPTSVARRATDARVPSITAVGNNEIATP